MHATIRRYELTDAGHAGEIIGKVNAGLVPLLSELPGFAGYRFIDHGQGAMTSIGIFETIAQADESTRVAAQWVSDEKLNDLISKPQVTSGLVVAAADPQPVAV